MKKTTMMVAVVAGLAMSASAGMLECWEMNDASGTALNAITNTGSIGSSWNWGDYTTDGSGNLTVPGDSGVNTRKAPPSFYATALAGSDTYSFFVDFGAWDMDAASQGDLLNYKLLDSANRMLANIFFEVDSATTVRLRMASDNSNYRNYAYTLTEAAGISARIDFNFADDTAEYFIDDVSQHSFDNFTTAANIGQILMGKGGAWTTAASSLDIDEIGLSVIPEPATLGMVAAVGGAILFIRRRLMI